MQNIIFLKKVLFVLGDKLPLHRIPILKEWIYSSDKWAVKNLLLSSEWVEKFVRYLEEDNTQLDRFYIYLCGILVDLSQKTGGALRIIKKSRLQSESKPEQTAERLFKSDIQSKKYFLLLLSNATILKNIRSATTEDNLFKIIYLRNKYSHPYLTEYMIKIFTDVDGREIQFDSNKYQKLINNGVDELALTGQLKTSLLNIKDQIIKLSSNLDEMRRL